MRTLLIILLKVLEIIAGLAVLYCCQCVMLLFPEEERYESLILNILFGVSIIILFSCIIYVIWIIIKELIPSWIKLNKKVVNKILKK